MGFQNIIFAVWDQLLLFLESYFAAWVIFTLLELMSPSEKQPLFSKHQYHEILNGLFVAVALWPLASLLKLYVFLGLGSLFPNGVLQLNWPFFAQLALGLILFDLIQYLKHRIMHSKLFWSFHVFHHSAIELRSSSHFRVHPFDFLISRLFSIVLMFIVGFDAFALKWILIAGVINNMWIHTNIDFDYGFPLRYVFTSPNYHKWHHASQLEHKDKNFADLFPVLDIIGGTYYNPPNMRPKAYGAIGLPIDSTVHQSFLGPMLYPFISKKKSRGTTPGTKLKT